MHIIYTNHCLTVDDAYIYIHAHDRNQCGPTKTSTSHDSHLPFMHTSSPCQGRNPTAEPRGLWPLCFSACRRHDDFHRPPRCECRLRQLEEAAALQLVQLGRNDCVRQMLMGWRRMRIYIWRKFPFSYSLRVQELCESRGGRPGLSVLTSLMVSVDVKQY